MDNTVDRYHLGYAHADDNIQHNMQCTAICDESRKDQVYIAQGYVAFDMEVVPDTANSLFLKLWDSVNCRSGDVYIDNKFFQKIRGRRDIRLARLRNKASGRDAEDKQDTRKTRIRQQ